MADCDDLLARARRKPASLRFAELCALAECYGYVFDRQRGTSHRIYKRPGTIGFMNFQKAKGGMAHAYQVRQLLMRIDEFDGAGGD